MKILISILVVLLCITQACTRDNIKLHESKSDLQFSHLATRWDEAIPLGNAMLGELVWQKGMNLRFSLDRADLWDLRPMKHLKAPKWSYKWVIKQWKNNNYGEVQKAFDEPYESNPAPSKIPGAALEFNIKSLGQVDSVRLSIDDATCEVNWKNGARLLTFVHASDHVGWFRFEGLNKGINPVIIPPIYNMNKNKGTASSPMGQGLGRLAYRQGKLVKGSNQITYNQKGWGGFSYQVHVSWKHKGNILEGCWSISSSFPKWKKKMEASKIVSLQMKKGFKKAFATHKIWWNKFWSKSSIKLPDSVIEKQWYLEQYKFGSTARKGAPPISLQAIWTADNGNLPPWKGDFHHDLNTELSYWPAYSGNHLDLEKGFLDWLWKNKSTFKKYTKTYFGSNGLNVPGVTTLVGKPMGGWIQYAFGPTVSAWLAYDFYLHWRYTMDRDFLAKKAYPWIKDVAIYLDEISEKDKNGMRKLPLSSTPEINNNARSAWFSKTTNFDLGLIRWTYTKAAETAKELGKIEDAKKWTKILGEWTDFAVDKETGLEFAPGFPCRQSHRHFSHLISIHPLGLIDWSQGQKSQQLIKKSIDNLKKQGSDWWEGYSFSWLANLQARMFDGEGAANSLRIFANHFCLVNSFHANGDITNEGYSKDRSRIFTLEGNFAFASGVQEMLIQSHTGLVKIFPAIPDTWKDVSFNNLRAEGAFVISAKKRGGEVEQVTIKSEMGGIIKLKNPFKKNRFKSAKNIKTRGDIITMSTKKGEVIVLNKK